MQLVSFTIFIAFQSLKFELNGELEQNKTLFGFMRAQVLLFESVDDSENVIKTGFEKRNEFGSQKKSEKRCEFFDEEIF